MSAPDSSGEAGGENPPRHSGDVAQSGGALGVMNQAVGSSNLSVPAKLFVIGRADLPPGLMAAQMFHAARLYASEYPFVESEWFKNSNTIVLLEVPDRSAIEGLFEKSRTANTVVAFREEGVEGITALCLGPDGEKLVSSLPLALKTLTPG